MLIFRVEILDRIGNFMSFLNKFRRNSTKYPPAPKRKCNLFSNLLNPFRGLYSERSCFPELSAPLFPSVRILSMVKNVVKSKHSPKGSTFRGVFSRSEVW